MSSFKWQPLEKRVYKYKNPVTEFFCPLCRTKRAIHSRPRLSRFNFAQIVLLTLLFVGSTYSFMGMKGIFSFFIFWTLFEAGVRLNFKREIPCPHCGFDATMYKKDVVKAKALVEEFWRTKGEQEQEEAVIQGDLPGGMFQENEQNIENNASL